MESVRIRVGDWEVKEDYRRKMKRKTPVAATNTVSGSLYSCEA